jgi:hypothetical protein
MIDVIPVIAKIKRPPKAKKGTFGYGRPNTGLNLIVECPFCGDTHTHTTDEADLKQSGHQQMRTISHYYLQGTRIPHCHLNGNDQYALYISKLDIVRHMGDVCNAPPKETD